jgi:SAM-dependent MidA family methyltransferase
LTVDEERHSRAARELIRERILAAGGWLSFADFMELALYAPGLGYYSAGAVKLGASGDFVTAPEVSDLFSRCVARQCADVLAATGGGATGGAANGGASSGGAAMGRTAEGGATMSGVATGRTSAGGATMSGVAAGRTSAGGATMSGVAAGRTSAGGATMSGVAMGAEILELGAGTGRMAVTILESLAEIGVLPERYAILEVSADLAERQRARVEQLPLELRQRVVWLDQFPRKLLRGVILANEVLDALPVQRFVVRSGKAYELGVSVVGAPADGRVGGARGAAVGGARRAAVGGARRAAVGGARRAAAPGFAWREGAELASASELVAGLPDGYTSEVCSRVEPWIAGVSQCLAQGALLLFDYGLPRSHYYHPQRVDGTLRCYFKQRAHDDPFINVGVQDITAWVDFTRVADGALAAGLDVSGFVTQAAFLLGTGIEAMTMEVDDVATRARLAGEARRLLMPGEMGESFKVMALCRDLDVPLRGFAYQDLRRSL